MIYDSYNVEKAATLIKSVGLENISESYSLTNQLKYDVNDKTHKHLLYKQFAEQNCKGCSIAPITHYIDNPIFQELSTEKNISLNPMK